MSIQNFHKSFILFSIFILISINVQLFGIVHAKESVLLIRSLGKNSGQIENAFRKSVEDLFTVDVLSTKYLTTQKIARNVSQTNPKAVILIDIQALAVFKKYRSELASGSNRPLIILLPDLLSSEKSYSLKASIAINYYPSISASVNILEEKIQKSIKKVGLVYHSSMVHEITKNIKYSTKDNLYIKPFRVGSGKELQSDLKRGLNELAQDAIEVIWVPNDPRLTTPDLIKNVWKPFFEKTKIMSIVLNPSLLTSNGGFGTMYIRPDYKAIGKKTGDIVRDHINNNIPITNIAMENDRAYFYSSFGALPAPAKPAPDTSQVLASSKEENNHLDTITRIVENQGIEDSIKETVHDTVAHTVASIDTQKNKTLLVVSNKNEEEKVTVPKTSSTTPAPPKEKKKQEEVKPPVTAKKSPVKVAEKKEKKGEDTIQDIDSEVTELVTKDEIDSISEVLSGIFLEITDTLTYIVKNLSDGSPNLGIAKNGERFPIVALDETGLWYKIQFYNDYGWVNTTSVKILKKSPLKQFLAGIFPSIEYKVLIGAIVIIFIILLIFIFLMIRKKNITRVPSGNSCMIVTRNLERIPYSDKDNFSITLPKFFKKLGFEVSVAKDLKTVKESLMHYVPNVVCVDWQFEVDIRSDIQKMLTDISLLSDMIIIFYNAIDSFHMNNEAKFARTFYFGTSFALKDIHEVISSLLNGKKSTQEDSSKDHYLTGKISNYNLVEIFQLLGSEKKTGCLIIECDVPVGLIFFNNSKIVYAITNDLKGKDAVFKILKLQEGMFRFVPDKVPISTNMDHDIFQVLMEWTTSMDKASQVDSNPQKK